MGRGIPAIKRSETGLAPRLNEVVEKRAKVDIKKDGLITFDKVGEK